jgi:hypothetical protein
MAVSIFTLFSMSFNQERGEDLYSSKKKAPTARMPTLESHPGIGARKISQMPVLQP